MFVTLAEILVRSNRATAKVIEMHKRACKEAPYDPSKYFMVIGIHSFDIREGGVYCIGLSELLRGCFLRLYLFTS